MRNAMVFAVMLLVIFLVWVLLIVAAVGVGILTAFIRLGVTLTLPQSTTPSFSSGLKSAWGG